MQPLRAAAHGACAREASTSPSRAPVRRGDTCESARNKAASHLRSAVAVALPSRDEALALLRAHGIERGVTSKALRVL